MRSWLRLLSPAMWLVRDGPLRVLSALEPTLTNPAPLCPLPYPLLPRVPTHPSVRDVQAGALRQLAAEFRRCIREGEVAEGAHPDLKELRAQRAANAAELRRVVEAKAQELFRMGAAERAQTALRQGRSCVAVRAGRQGEVGKGAVVLDRSQTGSTFYVEPPEAMALNNTERGEGVRTVIGSGELGTAWSLPI